MKLNNHKGCYINRSFVCMSGPVPTADNIKAEILSIITMNPEVAKKFKESTLLYSDHPMVKLIKDAIDKAIPKNPTMCIMCNKSTTDISKLCSEDCKKYYNERCLFCSDKLPTTSIKKDNAGNFCNETCYERHMISEETFRTCTCGKYIYKNNVTTYINGYVHCSLKCKTNWDKYNEYVKATSSNVQHNGFPVSTGVIVAGVRVGKYLCW